MEKLTGGWREL